MVPNFKHIGNSGYITIFYSLLGWSVLCLKFYQSSIDSSMSIIMFNFTFSEETVQTATSTNKKKKNKKKKKKANANKEEEANTSASQPEVWSSKIDIYFIYRELLSFVDYHTMIDDVCRLYLRGRGSDS